MLSYLDSPCITAWHFVPIVYNQFMRFSSRPVPPRNGPKQPGKRIPFARSRQGPPRKCGFSVWPSFQAMCISLRFPSKHADFCLRALNQVNGKPLQTTNPDNPKVPELQRPRVRRAGASLRGAGRRQRRQPASRAGHRWRQIGRSVARFRTPSAALPLVHWLKNMLDIPPIPCLLLIQGT